MPPHTLEYSKSSRAKCHGPPPCKGSDIAAGAIRYGQTRTNEYGETVEWRHWGCVTPEILAQLAIFPVEEVHGFRTLRAEDQQKIRRAVAMRRVDPDDMPDTMKAAPAIATTSSTPSQKKRKAAFEASGSSLSVAQPNSSSQSSSQPQRGKPLRELSFMDLSQAVEEEVEPEEETKDELYCTMTSNVVGVQYYKGLVGPGEEVRLIREPQNRYDRNAIQVKNIGQTQVGHLPRTVAIHLAPLLDRGLVTVEGFMNEGNLTGFSYSLSVTLKIYGPADKRAQLEPLLIWATPGKRGFPKRTGTASHPAPAPSAHGAVGGGPSHAMSAAPAPPRSQIPGITPAQAHAQQQPYRKQQEAYQKQQEAYQKQQEALRKAAELQQMLTTLEKVDDESRRNSLLDTLCAVDDILNLPLHPSPPGIDSGHLTVNLLKHQSQALQWCIEREYPVLPKKESDKPVQFWQVRKVGSKVFYFNIATKSPQESPPLLGRGALVADSMGLGKTLTMLALILATKADVPTDFSTSTLIVVPLSVLSNWEKQIDDHCVPGALSHYVYYGANRSISPQQLRKYDVVITTYQVVTKEHGDSCSTKGEPSKKKKKVEKNLFEIEWKRIILDEGHNIRNPRTKMAKAVCGLSAQRRWVLSGTPIINSPRDLGSIMTFLQICHPLDNEDFFKRLLLRPLKDGSPAGAELLRALMTQTCIRRTKEMKDSEGNYLVPLPPVEVTLVPVALSEEARTLYDAVEEVSQQRVEGFINGQGGISGIGMHSNVLSMLTRLRQIALHPGLVPGDYLEKLREAELLQNAPQGRINLSAEDRLRLQGLLARAIEDNEECPICFSILSEPRITSCAHPFCLSCITEVISRDPKCPMDRRPLTMGDLLEPPPPTDLTQAFPRLEAGDVHSGSSAKIDQLVHLLKLTPFTEKSLVFSQFTSFLDKIAETLRDEGIPFVRFDGQMSAKRRQETLEQFSVPLEEESTQNLPQIGRPSRSRRQGGQSLADIDDGGSGTFDQGDDFLPGEQDDGDDSFVEEDDSIWSTTKRESKANGKGKGKAPSKGSRLLSSSDGDAFFGENPKVMLISLKAGALGLNLTVANNVYLMDPYEGIESQAIDRVNRIGQKKPVHVYQLIAENTVEAKVIDIQEKKKKLIKEAFSGIKSNETQRQKKEARLQDLIELFGVRQRALSQDNSAG
ncbi:hypothetical protein JAAARDRAFT_35442 [Jaapia argillacea MUCL 33604]|uniref:Uncharacterized protein n=1 Tax=Jaapia argillacea MUCL 33604 TaxID=933084 RepID=A0A067PV75_9AGAM|nr:hypothetical protein JAAARDRAFT_35442 [Jaapia argillacea MUCL 33604]